MIGRMSSTTTALLLFFTLIGLVVLLIFLYRKLNKESNGEYTARRIVYKEGGVRDQMRRAALALETRLGIQLWPRGDEDDNGEEMQDVRDVEVDGSCGCDTEGGEEEEQEEGDEDDADEDDDNTDSCGRGNADDGSSLEESEERVKLKDEPKADEEKAEEAEDKQGKVKGVELLIDLNNLSGSAIWSEEHGGVDMGMTGTAL